MGMTVTEKIIARAAGAERVAGGDFINANVDKPYIKDLRFSTKEDAKGLYGVLLEVLQSIGSESVWNGARIITNLDEQPPRNERRAKGQEMARQFASEQGSILYDGAEGGIGHNVMVEHGHVQPGEFIVGADSHTCTYGALGAFATGIGFTETIGVLAIGKIWLKVPAAIRFDFTGKPGPCVVGKDIVLYVARKIGYEGAINRTLEYTGPGIQEVSIESRLTLCNMAVEIIAVNAIVPPDDQTIAYARETGNPAFEILQSDVDAPRSTPERTGISSSELGQTPRNPRDWMKRFGAPMHTPRRALISFQLRFAGRGKRANREETLKALRRISNEVKAPLTLMFSDEVIKAGNATLDEIQNLNFVMGSCNAIRYTVVKAVAEMLECLKRDWSTKACDHKMAALKEYSELLELDEYLDLELRFTPRP